MFKIGDTVFITKDDGNYDLDFCGSELIRHGVIPDVSPKEGIIKKIGEERSLVEYTVGIQRMCLSFRNDYITNNKNKMNIKEKFATMFLSEPEKTFRKAEITNGDNMLTSQGEEIFLSFLLKKFGDEFKKEVVDELVKEDCCK